MFLRRHSRSTESRPLWSSCQVQSWDQRLSEPGSRSSTGNSMPSSSAVETAACAPLRACLPEVTFHSGSCRLGLSITLPEISGYPSLRNALWRSSEPENDVLFVNNSSIGFYPYLVLERERRRRRKRLSKWIAMMLAMPRVLRNLPLFRLTILVEGNVEPCRSPCVFVGNNEYRISGPGLGARERLDRGELCLYVARTQGRLSMFWLACRCILGLVRQQRDLRIFKGATADISARRSRLLVAFDGEVATMQSPLHYKIRRGALRVFAPPNWIGS